MQEESNMFNHEDSLFLFLKDSANVHRCTWSVGHVALGISGSLKHVVLVADICMKNYAHSARVCLGTVAPGEDRHWRCSKARKAVILLCLISCSAAYIVAQRKSLAVVQT